MSLPLEIDDRDPTPLMGHAWQAKLPHAHLLSLEHAFCGSSLEP